MTSPPTPEVKQTKISESYTTKDINLSAINNFGAVNTP